LNAHLIVLTFAVVFLGNAAEMPTAGAENLLRMLPEKTRHVLYVNRFSEAWSAALPNGPGSADVLGVRDGRATQEFDKRFAMPAKTLAEHNVSGLLRAAVAAPDGSLRDLLIAETPTPERARELLSESIRVAETQGARVERIAGSNPAGAVLRWTDERTGARVVHLVVVGRLLISATDAQLAEEVAAIVRGAKSWKPSHLPGLTEIVAGRRLEWPEDRPGLLWCSNPWGSADGESQLEASAQRHGLTGIQAVGGLVTSDSSRTLVGQTQILAPGPHQGSLRILQLSPGKDWEAPGWLCQELDEMVLLHGNVSRAFEYIGDVFDDLYADGIAGTYEAVLEDLKDANGLNIDLRSQLYAHLGPLVLLARHRGSDTDGGKASVTYAFQTAQPERVAKAVHTLMVDDPEAEPVRVAGCEHPLWRMSGQGQEPRFGDRRCPGAFWSTPRTPTCSNAPCPRTGLPIRHWGPQSRLCEPGFRSMANARPAWSGSEDRTRPIRRRGRRPSRHKF
jgi:hypothetical protein